MALPQQAADIIARLDLKPHPEGGHYRETFRDESVDADGRSRSTAIYFLLARGERSHWHRVDAVEIWHYYAGDALTLRIADEMASAASQLGADLAAGEDPAGGRARACLAGGREQRRLDTWLAAPSHPGLNLRSLNSRRKDWEPT